MWGNKPWQVCKAPFLESHRYSVHSHTHTRLQTHALHVTLFIYSEVLPSGVVFASPIALYTDKHNRGLSVPVILRFRTFWLMLLTQSDIVQ